MRQAKSLFPGKTGKDESPFQLIIVQDIPLSDTSLSTVFYVKLNNYCFPDSQWTDLTYDVLMMWVAEIVRGQSVLTKRTLYFMDGPYRIEITKASNTEVSLHFLRHDIILHEGTCTCKHILSGILAGLNTFQGIVKCESASHPALDSVARDMERSIAQIQGVLQRITSQDDS